MDLFCRKVHGVTLLAGTLLSLYLVSGVRELDPGMDIEMDGSLSKTPIPEKKQDMDVEMEEEPIQQRRNPVVQDVLYQQMKDNWHMHGSTHVRKEALGQVCLRVMERVHNVYDVRVANLCRRGRCPPEELGIRLKYKRALLGATGAFDYLADGTLKQALNTVTTQMAPFFGQCMDRTTSGNTWRSQPGWSVVSAALARFYGVGNCGEMADLALTEATHWAALLGFRVESLAGENYDHAWTVFNRNPTTDVQWPSRWNDDAVICDNWLGQAINPKDMITDINQPRNPNLTPMQRLEIVDNGGSRYLHEVMPGANVLRDDTQVPHTTQVSATSEQLLGLWSGTQAENVDLWANPTAQCAAETDREVNNYLQKIPEAQPWLRVFQQHYQRH